MLCDAGDRGLILVPAPVQAVYRYKKAHLPGDKWTIPIIGKFADSLNPSLENYKRQWNSGALSVVSVFNMCVWIGNGAIGRRGQLMRSRLRQLHRHCLGQ